MSDKLKSKRSSVLPKIIRNEFDFEEIKINHEIQKKFVDLQLPECPLFDVIFFDTANQVPPKQQQFFLWLGKWRNTDPKSKMGFFIFEENAICSKVFYNSLYYEKVYIHE